MNVEIDPEVPRAITVRDIEMVYIPAGTFLMGSNEGDDGEKPRHEVYLDGFYIARYPVTNAQYREYVAATAHPLPDHWKPGPFWKIGTWPRRKEDHPVVFVSWRDALGYCRWLSAVTRQEVRLPTEAEWEKAARGTDGWKYPWANEFDESKCNSQASMILDTTPVGRYSPEGDSPYGVADMAGNVSEWTNSLHRPYPYNLDDGREDVGLEEAWRVVRGGSFEGLRWHVRCAFRGRVISAHRLGSRGFRCAIGSPK
jgi:formylglycine-generating enzyme required for sulfatase activity